MDYPFAALVGLEQLKTALLVNAVYPEIGGVLIRGERGTAKSTAARALAALLPAIDVVAGCPFHCPPQCVWSDCPNCQSVEPRETASVSVPFVDLPLGATEDRVIGTLDFEQALRAGRRAFHPGLLAAAHRGILYIDEVNLLPDHLVDALLDAAASGVNTVAREGISVSHPARFLLVGTMNPEEGELRPQLLDRFGLMVEVAAPREPEVRAEVVRRRLAFESDAATFAASWQAEQQAQAGQIVRARELLPRVALDDGLLALITRICCDFDVDGLRADIALHKTARALAALNCRLVVAPEDVKQAAELVLPHRRRRLTQPARPPSLDRDKLQSLIQASEQEASGASDGPGSANSPDNNDEPTEAPEQRFEPDTSASKLQVPTAKSSRSPLPGRRQPAPSGTGRFVRAVADPKAREPALAATIQAAARRGARAASDGILELVRGDLHRQHRAGTAGSLILFVVDASGSMAARRRMELVKGAVLGLLGEAYTKRDQVGVIAFRGLQAELLLPPTSSIEQAEHALRALPTGGRTPLAHALELCRDTVRTARRGQPELPVQLVLLSDGKGNVPLPGTSDDPFQQALAAARALATESVQAIVVDSAAGFVRSGRAAELADALGGEYRPIQEMIPSVQNHRVGEPGV